MIAARLGATVVPVRLEGVDRVLHRRWKMARPARVRVTFGAPLRPVGADYAAVARQIEAAVRALPPGDAPVGERDDVHEGAGVSSPVSGSRPAGGLMLIAAIAALAPVRSQPPAPDPLAFLEPGIELTRGERARLNANEAVARALPGQDGQLAVLAATRLDAPAEALVAWTRAIAAFKRSQFVLAIGRFSDPPVLSDLDALTLDDDDVDELRRCRPGDCGVKLSASEIAALANVAAAGGAEVARRRPAGIPSDRPESRAGLPCRGVGRIAAAGRP